MFAKVYIPLPLLQEFSEFKYPEEDQYTDVQRGYAIIKILHSTVTLATFYRFNKKETKTKRDDYRRFTEDGIIAGVYMPHNPETVEGLLKDWAMVWNIFKPMPIERIRAYFGATIAIHYAWRGYFNAALLLASKFFA